MAKIKVKNLSKKKQARQISKSELEKVRGGAARAPRPGPGEEQKYRVTFGTPTIK